MARDTNHMPRLILYRSKKCECSEKMQVSLAPVSQLLLFTKKIQKTRPQHLFQMQSAVYWTMC